MKVLVIKNSKIEGLGSLEGMFEYDAIEAYEGASIPKVDDYDALIILGGQASAYDDLSYIKEEIDVIKYALKIGKPILGICLGSQLIAKACNARVYKGSRKEIGFYEVMLKNSLARLFKKDKIKVFQWHNDTFTLPDNAELLATSDYYPIQAFRIKNALAIQFHLEVDDKMILEWLNSYKDDVKDVDIDAIIKDIHTVNLEYYCRLLWKHLLAITFNK